MIPTTDPNLWDIDIPRLSHHSTLVLSALRTGPKSNMELAAISHRFGARICDLRKAGYNIVTIPLRDGSGRVTYRLLPGRGGSAKASEPCGCPESAPTQPQGNQANAER